MTVQIQESRPVQKKLSEKIVQVCNVQIKLK